MVSGRSVFKPRVRPGRWSARRCLHSGLLLLLPALGCAKAVQVPTNLDRSSLAVCGADAVTVWSTRVRLMLPGPARADPRRAQVVDGRVCLPWRALGVRDELGVSLALSRAPDRVPAALLDRLHGPGRAVVWLPELLPTARPWCPDEVPPGPEEIDTTAPDPSVGWSHLTVVDGDGLLRAGLPVAIDGRWRLTDAEGRIPVPAGATTVFLPRALDGQCARWLELSPWREGPVELIVTSRFDPGVRR